MVVKNPETKFRNSKIGIFGISCGFWFLRLNIGENSLKWSIFTYFRNFGQTNYIGLYLGVFGCKCAAKNIKNIKIGQFLPFFGNFRICRILTLPEVTVLQNGANFEILGVKQMYSVTKRPKDAIFRRLSPSQRIFRRKNRNFRHWVDFWGVGPDF